MTHPLTSAALSNPHTQSSFNTLDKHAARGTIDTSAAMRLLRNNVRDVAPGAGYETTHRIATDLLTHWRDSRNTVDTATPSE